MVETLLVVGIVCLATVLAGRSFHRTVKGINEGHECSGCLHCTCLDREKRFPYSSSDNYDRCGHSDPEAVNKTN